MVEVHRLGTYLPASGFRLPEDPFESRRLREKHHHVPRVFDLQLQDGRGNKIVCTLSPQLNYMVYQGLLAPGAVIVVLKVQRHWDDTKNPPVHITLLLEVQVVPHLSHHNTQLSLSCRNTIVGPCEASPCQYRLPAWSRFSLEKAADYYCRLDVADWARREGTPITLEELFGERKTEFDRCSCTDHLSMEASLLMAQKASSLRSVLELNSNIVEGPLIGRVAFITPLRDFQQPGEAKAFPLTATFFIADNTLPDDVVAVTLWNTMVLKHYYTLSVGQMVSIRNASIKRVSIKEKRNDLPDARFELSLNERNPGGKLEILEEPPLDEQGQGILPLNSNTCPLISPEWILNSFSVRSVLNKFEKACLPGVVVWASPLMVSPTKDWYYDVHVFRWLVVADFSDQLLTPVRFEANSDGFTLERVKAGRVIVFHHIMAHNHPLSSQHLPSEHSSFCVSTPLSQILLEENLPEMEEVDKLASWVSDSQSIIHLYLQDFSLLQQNCLCAWLACRGSLTVASPDEVMDLAAHLATVDLFQRPVGLCESLHQNILLWKRGLSEDTTARKGGSGSARASRGGQASEPSPEMSTSQNADSLLEEVPVFSQQPPREGDADSEVEDKGKDHAVPTLEINASPEACGYQISSYLLKSCSLTQHQLVLGTVDVSPFSHLLDREHVTRLSPGMCVSRVVQGVIVDLDWVFSEQEASMMAHDIIHQSFEEWECRVPGALLGTKVTIQGLNPGREVDLFIPMWAPFCRRRMQGQPVLECRPESASRRARKGKKEERYVLSVSWSDDRIEGLQERPLIGALYAMLQAVLMEPNLLDMTDLVKDFLEDVAETEKSEGGGGASSSSSPKGGLKRNGALPDSLLFSPVVSRLRSRGKNSAAPASSSHKEEEAEPQSSSEVEDDTIRLPADWRWAMKLRLEILERLKGESGERPLLFGIDTLCTRWSAEREAPDTHHLLTHIFFPHDEGLRGEPGMTSGNFSA